MFDWFIVFSGEYGQSQQTEYISNYFFCHKNYAQEVVSSTLGSVCNGPEQATPIRGLEQSERQNPGQNGHRALAAAPKAYCQDWKNILLK